MKTIQITEIIASILVGAIVVTWVLYLAVRCLQAGRDAADRNRRIYDNEYRRPKK